MGVCLKLCKNGVALGIFGLVLVLLPFLTSYSRSIEKITFIIAIKTNVRSTKTSESFNVQHDITRHVPTIVNDDPNVKARPQSDKTETDITRPDVAIKATNKTLYAVIRHAPYLLENPFLCSSEQNLSILVIVHTAPEHFDRRNTIRETWTNETYFGHPGRLRVLFLLGRVKNETIQHGIEKEFMRYSDLLQGDFIDDYNNRTHKDVMAYKWLTERCRNAKLILKVDDDIVINTYDLWTEYYPAYQHKSKQTLCHHVTNSGIQRKKMDKWYVEENDLRGQKTYPRYCGGGAVLLTNDIIPVLYQATLVTPYLWVDDEYLYGFLPGQVPGVKYNQFKNGVYINHSKGALQCYKSNKLCNLLAAGANDRATADIIWAYMTKTYKSKQSA